MEEIDAMQNVAASLDKLPNDARQRVLAWAISKFAPDGVSSGSSHLTSRENNANKSLKPAPKPKSPKSGKKPKITISMDKSLNLVPSGSPSAMDFQKVLLGDFNNVPYNP